MEPIEDTLRLLDAVLFGPAFPRHAGFGANKYDFFLSHAGEDKDAVARPLAAALRARGFSVWFDEFALKVGDSLSGSIDRGLAQSRFGIVILSRAFFRKNWPARELRGLVAREVQGKAAILPVWHGVTRDEVLAQSPTLADVIAVDTARGTDHIVDALTSVVTPADLGKGFDQWLRGNMIGHVRNGRLPLPSPFGDAIGRDVVVTSITGKSARIFPLAVWTRLEETLATVRTESASLARFLDRAKYYGSVQVVEAHTGIDIREPLRSAAGLSGEVAIFGQLNFLEVWDHARFVEQIMNDPFTETDARALADYGI